MEAKQRELCILLCKILEQKLKGSRWEEGMRKIHAELVADAVGETRSGIQNACSGPVNLFGHTRMDLLPLPSLFGDRK